MSVQCIARKWMKKVLVLGHDSRVKEWKTKGGEHLPKAEWKDRMNLFSLPLISLSSLSFHPSLLSISISLPSLFSHPSLLSLSTSSFLPHSLSHHLLHLSPLKKGKFSTSRKVMRHRYFFKNLLLNDLFIFLCYYSIYFLRVFFHFFFSFLKWVSNFLS